MKPSIRIILLQCIRDYVDMRGKLRSDYDELLKVAPAEANSLMNELESRETKLDEVWKLAVPEMNPLERKRYATMIGHDPDSGSIQQPFVMPATETTPYPQSVLDVLERVRKVFPNAKILAFAKPGEPLVVPQIRSEQRFHRPEVLQKPVQGIQRDVPAAQPAAPTTPEQPRLL